ncbi:MAG: hypothetical protein H8E46_07675 [FCB group bacterium]|nr:hypothetical protein [FCB group bacterium]
MILSVKAQSLERKQEWNVSAGGYIWCSAGGGLYQYDVEEETWSRVGSIKKEITEVKFWEDRLWAGGDGLYNGNPDLGDWLYNDESTGFPGPEYRALNFGEEYYWAASDSGAARYDPILEEWEVIAGGGRSFVDLTISDQYVFFTGENGIYRYDRNYESGIEVNPADTGRFYDYKLNIDLQDEIWFAGEEAVTIYNKKSRSWSDLIIAEYFPEERISQIFKDNERLWVITDENVYWIYWRSRDVRLFPRSDRIRDYEIREIAGNAGMYYFATDKGLLIYNENDEQWELVNQANGLAEMNIERLSVQGQLVLLQTDKLVQVYSLADRRVLPGLRFDEPGKSGRGENLYWDARGLGGRLDQGEVNLKGNYVYLSEGWTDGDGSGWEDRHRRQLYPSANIADRQLSGYYDDTDQDEILFGAVFRGLRDDNFRRAEYSNRVGYKLSNSRLLGGTVIEGGSGSLEYGDRSPLKGRREFEIGGTYGKSIVKSASEIFFGEGDIIYSLDRGNIMPHSAEVYINGEKISSSDYMLTNTTGLLNFTFSGAELLDDNDKIQVNYQYFIEESDAGNFSGGDFTMAQGDKLMESVSFFDSDSLSAGRVSGEIRAGGAGSEFRFTPELAMSKSMINGEGFAGSGDVSGRMGRFLVSARYVNRDDKFESLDPASTEFGSLRKESGGQAGYEGERVSAYLNYSDIEGDYGVERSAGYSGYYYLSENASFFNNADVRRADSDSLNRDYMGAKIGCDLQLSRKALDFIGFRNVEFYGELKGSVTEKEFSLQPDSADSKSYINSLYCRTIISPTSKISFTPELLAVDKSRTVSGGDNHPYLRLVKLEGIGNVLEVVPGVNHYLNWTAEYNQDDFAFGERDVFLYRKGYLSTEFFPAQWMDELGSFNFGVTFYRSDRDSLIDFDEGLPEIWGKDGNYSVFNGSDVYRISVFPGNRWEMTEILKMSEGTGSEQLQSQSSLWWRGDMSQVVIRFNYTGNKTDPAGNITYSETEIYNPYIEWQKRWGGGMITRLSFNGSRLEGAAYDEIFISPSIYAEKYFSGYFREDVCQLRNDITPYYREITGDYTDEEAGFVNSLYFDYKFLRKIILRFHHTFDYNVNLSNDIHEKVNEFEFRLTIKF